MKGWDTALEEQNDLRHSFVTQQGQRYMEKFADALAGHGKMFDPKTLQETDGDPETAWGAVASAIATVEYGDPMWVSGDVVELVAFAAQTFQPEALMPDDVFTPHAFALLDHPLYMTDARTLRLGFRAISWGQYQAEDNPGKMGLVVALWSDMRDADDYDLTGDSGRIGNTHLALAHVGQVAYGDDRFLAEPSNRSLMQHLQVMFRLAQQEVVVPGRERVSRPVWRRKSNWRQIKEVQVLTLRRAKPSKYEGPERDVEWSHRWFVHGHWRNQWYPSMKRHMQIWIDGYVKGPDDKPFVPKRRAIEFTR